MMNFESTPQPIDILLVEDKEDADLKSIPVVILTTSKAEEDILECYRLHANCFITKPVDLDQFVSVVNHIEDFWLAIVRLPKNRKTCALNV